MRQTIDNIRAKFPFFQEQSGSGPIIYFDNAATSQRPKTVIDAINLWNVGANANVHRAVHHLSNEATVHYENGREAVRRFVNASDSKEIIFTSGTTASINLLANSFGSKFISKGDEVLISEGEHHSNIVPWQMLCERKGAVLKYIPIDENGEWKMKEIDSLLASGKVKIVSAAHISNVLGIVNQVEELTEIAHKHGVPVHLDGAQGIVHADVDVKRLDCDFYSFSGHKIYAATGTGVLYGREDYLREMPPWMGGGEMVGTVTYEKSTYAELPLKFEAGTPNFVGGATFTPALEFAASIKTPEIQSYERDIIDYLSKELNSIEGLRIYGVSERKIPLFSFTVEGVHHSDLSMILDKMGIAVRSGLMCSEPLISKFGQTGMVRISLVPYNTAEECETFIKALKRAIRMLR